MNDQINGNHPEANTEANPAFNPDSLLNDQPFAEQEEGTGLQQGGEKGCITADEIAIELSAALTAIQAQAILKLADVLGALQTLVIQTEHQIRLQYDMMLRNQAIAHQQQHQHVQD